MKKYLSLVISAITMFSALKAEAVAVGDIYYSDKTFSTNLDTNKVPIGLAYWVDESAQHGYIMGLNQPTIATYTNANTYCNNYTTLGTAVGDWRLPDLLEGMQMMTQSWNGVSNNKFTMLNTKLATIPGYGEVLANGGNYHIKITASSYQSIVLSTGQLVLSGTSSSVTYYPRCVMKF